MPQPSSSWQLDEQPSPAAVLLSSHSSPASVKPLPQTGKQLWVWVNGPLQLLVQLRDWIPLLHAPQGSQLTVQAGGGGDGGPWPGTAQTQLALQVWFAAQGTAGKVPLPAELQVTIALAAQCAVSATQTSATQAP